MDTAAKEQYVFHYLTLIDMGRVLSSLELLQSETNKSLQEALFRDAVVCYAKAFSGNRNLAGKRVLRMDESFVPSELVCAHREVLNLRDKIVAHVDLDNQAPLVDVFEINGEKKVTFTVKGYERLFTSHLVEPLKVLAAEACSYCRTKLEALEKAA